jgi:glycosyltransferase involved in cell wall biosynthesis
MQDIFQLKAKRILFVQETLELGGAERQSLILAEQLRDKFGADVSFLGFGAAGMASDRCEQLGIPWKNLGRSVGSGMTRFEKIKTIGYITQAIRGCKPDIILPYTYRPNIICNMVWKATGAKTCIWNQRDAGVDARFSRTLEKLSCRQSRLFITNSPDGHAFLIEQLGVPRNKVRTIYNGTMTQPALKSRDQWRTELGIGEDGIVVSMIANIHHLKDHKTLLHAWKLLLDKVGDRRPLKLVLAGRISESVGELLTLAHNLGIYGNVMFLGSVADVFGLLAASDFSVFSSKTEGLPNGVLEAMAAGLAICGTNLPGIRLAVGDENIRFLSPKGDAVTLCDKMGMLISDEGLRLQVGRQNRQRIAESFSVDQMVDKTVEAISAAL